MTSEKDLYKECVEAWGVESQLTQTIQECAELIFAITKLTVKGKSAKTINAVREEIADVELMVNQIKHIFNESEVERFKQKKIKRIRARLNKSR